MSYKVFNDWSNVSWESIDTTPDGRIDSEEAANAKIIIWEGMTQKEFNKEKQLRQCVGHYSTATLTEGRPWDDKGCRHYDNPLVKEILALGKQIVQLEKEQKAKKQKAKKNKTLEELTKQGDEYCTYKNQEFASSLYVSTPQSLKYDPLQNETIKEKIMRLRGQLTSLATRVFGPLKQESSTIRDKNENNGNNSWITVTAG